MKVLNSLKSAKTRHRDCKVVRRRGKVFVICKSNPRFKARLRSALAGLETRVGLADHEDLAPAADDLAVAVAGLGRLEGVEDFHGDSGM